MKLRSKKSSLLFILLLLAGFVSAQNRAAYLKQTDDWHAQRIENLKKENGWLNLVGLYWLSPGKNSFGSGANNKIIFPKGTIPKNAGYFQLNDDSTVILVPLPAVNITIDNKTIGTQQVFNKEAVSNPTVSYRALRWTIIKRKEKIGIRLRDLNSAALSQFKGIARFPVDTAWKLEAVLDTLNRSAGVAITNVLGQTNVERSAGKLLFTLHNKTYSLDALEEGDELFIIFGDATNGESTYPSGRFLYAPKPGPSGKIILDFNKAYNPPCAFTIYATCPLPPKQNLLPIAVTAGEKDYGHHAGN